MNTSHTPGPWKVSKSGKRLLVTAGSLIVASATPMLLGKEREANARMIAAVPDLMEALRDLADLFHQGHVTPRTEAEGCVAAVLDSAELAIKKAEGA